jgi:hypothetical protein
MLLITTQEGYLLSPRGKSRWEFTRIDETLGWVLLLPPEASNWQSQNPQSTTLILQTTQRGGGEKGGIISKCVPQPVALATY